MGYKCRHLHLWPQHWWGKFHQKFPMLSCTSGCPGPRWGRGGPGYQQCCHTLTHSTGGCHQPIPESKSCQGCRMQSGKFMTVILRFIQKDWEVSAQNIWAVQKEVSSDAVICKKYFSPFCKYTFLFLLIPTVPLCPLSMLRSRSENIFGSFQRIYLVFARHKYSAPLTGPIFQR